jgi:hypothetical protein
MSSPGIEAVESGVGDTVGPSFLARERLQILTKANAYPTYQERLDHSNFMRVSFARR